MNSVVISPGKLSGKVTIPSSKSISHRAVICAGLSDGISNIENVVFSQDIIATSKAMEGLGVNLIKDNSAINIKGTGQLKVKNPIINCYESGSTLRFLIPIAAAIGEKIKFIGKGRLIDRPLQPYYDMFDEQQLYYENDDGKLPLTIDGKLKPGEYRIKGNISSQFISGLLFALPLLEGDSKIILTTPLESKPYVALTIEMLKKFSVCIENNAYKEILIKGNQKYKPTDYRVEGDYSQAAFWLVAGTLGADVACEGLNMKSLQGDRVIIEIMKSMGAKFIGEDDKIKALPSTTWGSIIDASQCPDLVPILAVLAALSKGTTEIINAGRLRIKESDRLSAITSELSKIGADIEERPEGLIIRGREALKGGTVSSWNDHRIAMVLAIASIKCREPIIIQEPDCVKKSYPDFWKDFKGLGGKIDEWNLGQ
ncbi:MAG: 3-phosphoshikimate 1-carboxyvinyltransferase [Clostridiales bacterium]|nr:3-phosphoshikimate 1-carboxyvinyltransferase [Clostridiales bacterium]